MDPLYGWVRPWLFKKDAEAAHRLTLAWARRASHNPLALALAKALYRPAPDPRLETQCFGLRFPNPLGLAAGLDKDGEAIDLWAALGFGFIELGTVTPGEGQPGNEPPRLARLVDEEAIVNRMGFNNRGAPHLAASLAARKTAIPCGANLGKAKITPLERAADDYEAGLRAVWPVADYLVINVSSPNTPGLRDLQAVEALAPLLTRARSVERSLAQQAGRPSRPILLKIAPDLADPDIDAVADLALDAGMDGIIATNTTLRHELVKVPPPIAGGLSGRPLGPRALELVRRLYGRLGRRLPIVGVGGIMSADDAYARIRAGASLVQIYSGLVYHGPGLIRSILEGLAARLANDGIARIGEAVGADSGSR